MALCSIHLEMDGVVFKVYSIVLFARVCVCLCVFFLFRRKFFSFSLYFFPTAVEHTLEYINSFVKRQALAADYVCACVYVAGLLEKIECSYECHSCSCMFYVWMLDFSGLFFFLVYCDCHSVYFSTRKTIFSVLTVCISPSYKVCYLDINCWTQPYNVKATVTLSLCH